MSQEPDMRFGAPELLNANALVDSDVTMLSILREAATNRYCPYITPERLKRSLTRMDVAVVRVLHLDGVNPIVAMGTLSRVETLGRACGRIQDVVVGNGYVHHRANLVASVVGRLLARAQEFAMESVDLHQVRMELAASAEVLATHGYKGEILGFVYLTELR